MGDTSRPSNVRYHELLRALAEAGIRERHPDATDEEVRTRLTVRLYGRAAAEKLFGAVPGDAR